MFGFSKSVVEIKANPLPAGVDEIVFCVFDDKLRLLHRFRSEPVAGDGSALFQNHDDSELIQNNGAFREAVESGEPVSTSSLRGDGTWKCIHVLPYQSRRGKPRYACFITGIGGKVAGRDNPAFRAGPTESGRTCLLLADPDHGICAVSSFIPEAFGYAASHLAGKDLTEIISPVHLELAESSPPDTNESILSCVFYCRDGSKRDVELRKYSAPDNLVLFAIRDLVQPQSNEESSQATARERRRIGQDLHDSIGQLLTGISLLSRSLANGLTRVGSLSEASDASQISSLADEASNQIRQISRSLIPSEIVEKGLFKSLRELARTTTASCGLICSTRIDDSVEFADGAVENHLYRIAQEAVNNAVRHAGASRIEILISQENGIGRLEVVDNGTWRNMANMMGIGLKTMEYRATAIGARLSAGADPHGGSRVVCVLDADDIMAV